MSESESPHEILPPYTEKKILDQFEVNNSNQQIFEARYDPDQSAFKTIRQMFMDKYSYDIMGDKTGPYTAIVLEVLSGPQVNNAASTKDNKTNTINIASLRDPKYQAKEAALKDPPIRVIARVPEFDIDIDWPKNNKDSARIASHSEFHSMWEDNKTNGVDQIVPGSVIHVSYNNTENLTGFDGRPAGTIIGLQEQPNQPIKFNLRQSAKKIYNPPCKAARQLAGPSGGLYISNTVTKLHDAGPPIRRLKNRIKTGMYGNGTPQTKAHFDEALKLSKTSVKHGIDGAAPDSRNAFVWVGHLKNNGYMDLLDRPISLGRETIIYAPMMLDLASPIEIKYYFHDRAGFGHAWLSGPDASITDATGLANTPGNDFKDLIGPAVKDLIKDGRNFILVIPEMAHSRGFGTTNTATERFEKILNGKKTNKLGEKQGSTIRTSMDGDISSLVKNYLRRLPISDFYQQESWIDDAIAGKTLLQVTHLRQRETVTFDGSYTGGNFGAFHEEVVQVLNEHLGTINDKISYISILANGLGAINLASLCVSMPSAFSHSDASEAFKNLNIKRIDFIDSGRDTVGNHGFPESPSSAIYDSLLLPKSHFPGFMEFNYITDLVEPKHFFDKTLTTAKYQKHNKAVTSYGEQKFSFFVNEQSNPENYISFHMAAPGEKVGYAFSMINSFLTDFELPPANKKSDASQKPAISAVPDHAAALASKPSEADVAMYKKEAVQLQAKVNYFEEFLLTYKGNPDGICANSKFAVFCKNGNISGDKQSAMFAAYTTYLQDKRRLLTLTGPARFLDPSELLIGKELSLKEIENNKSALGQELANAKDFLSNIKKHIKESDTYNTWKWLNSEPLMFLRSPFVEDPEIAAANAAQGITHHSPRNGGQDLIDFVEIIASFLAAEDAYEILIPKIDNVIKESSAEPVNIPPGCEPPPRKLGDFSAGNIPPGPFPRRKSDAYSKKQMACAGKIIKVARNFEELAEMIPWYPEKEDFSFGNERFSKDQTKINEIEGFATSKFKYKARSSNGGGTYHESPPMWACITDAIARSWDIACTVSNYTPFKIVTGIKGTSGKKGVTAYKAGVPLSTFGLAFSVDPQLTGYSTDGDPLHSIFTGAWTPGFVDMYGRELYNLGVFYDDSDSFWTGRPYMDNAYSDPGVRRSVTDWYWASHSYNGRLVEGEDISTVGSELEDANIDYDDIMEFAKNGPIIMKGANPVLWLITFCEKSGMKWGNSQFLKRRHRGGTVWNSAEQRRIAAIYGIPDIVARINAISWESETIENHMHFQYYDDRSLIKWSEIAAAKSKAGK